MAKYDFHQLWSEIKNLGLTIACDSVILVQVFFQYLYKLSSV